MLSRSSAALHEPTKYTFERIFREYGLPDAIRTDNGAPFSTLAAGGLSRLSVWWIKLGIRPERIMPGRPDQNGRHERMHSTLKAETAKPPKATLVSQQRAFDRFIEEYNNVRPHEALGQEVPASLYTSSLRKMPDRVPEIEYPSHFEVEKVYRNGVISFASAQWYTSLCLRDEYVGLEEVDNDCSKIYFGPIALGIIDLQNAKDRGKRAFGHMVRVNGIPTNPKQRRRPYRR